jgi:hypothetical protein
MIQQPPFFSRQTSHARRWWEWSQQKDPAAAAAADPEKVPLTVNNNNNEAAVVAVEEIVVNTEEEDSIATQAVLALHALLWIAVIALVAALFATHAPPVQTTYALAPWERSGLIDDIVPVRARFARGLFADNVNVAVACLVAQSTLAVLIPERRVGGIVVAIVAILILFMQEKWKLTFGGLLWSELVLAVTFFSVGSRLRTAALPLSMPVLAVAALANAGETDSSGLTTVYFALCGMPLLWHLALSVPPSAEAAPDATVAPEKHEGYILGASAWLSVIPLFARGGLVLARGVGHAWAYAALVFVLVWVGLLLLGLGAWPQLARGTQTTLYALHQLAHATLLLLLLIGLFKN